MKRLLLGLLAVLGAVGVARADHAVSLYTGTTTYLQLYPDATMPKSYRLVFPSTAGLVNQALAIRSVTGSTVALSFVTFMGGGGGSAAWGAITGTLSNQSDLQTVLSAIGASTATLSATTGTLSVSTASLQSQLNGLGSIYLTQSSATTTYLTQSSATATYALHLPNTAVAVGTTSNTVTGNAAIMSANLTTGQLYIKNQTGTTSTATLTLDDPGFGPIHQTVIKIQDGGSDQYSLRYSNQNNPESRLYWYNDGGGTEFFNLSNASTMTVLVPLALRGTVNVSSGVLCNGSAGTLGQFMTSGGNGGPCTWTTGSSGGVVGSSGVVFGGPTGTPTTDTTTFVWDNTAKALSVTGTARVTGAVTLDSLIGGGNGYVPFVNSAGVLSQYNFFTWDNSNKRLGIGYAFPSYELDVSGAMRVKAQHRVPVSESGGVPVSINDSDLIQATGDIVLNSASTNDTLMLEVKNISAGNITVTANNGCTVESAASLTMATLEGARFLYNDGACDWKILSHSYGPASATTTGVLTSTDWNTFNNKGSGGGGASTLAVATGTATAFVTRSSPTAVVNFDATTFSAALTGGATAYVTLNPSSVTLQGNNLGATYLTNSSATATYLNQSSATATYLNQTAAAATYLTQANATSTYLAQSSATATYLQNSSATATYLSTIGAAATYLAQSSATATYLQNSSATATYLNKTDGAATYLTQSSATATYLNQSSATATYANKSVFATTTSTGVLSATDWNTFNGKQSAGAYLTAVAVQGPLQGNGTAGSPLLTSTATATSTGSLTAADWSTFNGKGVGTITGITTQNGIVGGGTSGALTVSVSSVSLSTQTVGTLGVANGGTGLTAAVNNRVMVGNGSVWVSTTVPSCSDPTASKLLFNSATNTFTCGSDQGGTGAGDNLGNHVATTTLNMSNFGVANIGTGGSSFAASGLLTLNSGLAFAAQNTQTAAYTVTSTDTVIRANATSAGLTVNLPSASANDGQVLTISKVDTTTGTITILANGTDLIEGTSTIKMNAFTQTASIISDGVSNWLPWGAGIQTTPAWVGTGFTGTTANTLGVASQTICQAFYTPVPVAIDSMTVHIGAASGLMDIGIYDTNGTTGKLLGSTGQFAQSVGRYNRTLTSVLQLPPGQYYQCIVANNITTSVTSLSYASGTVPPSQLACASGSGGAIPLSTSLTWSSCTAVRNVLYNMWAHTVGGNL